MITKENITVYQCEHCKKKLFRKNAMERHEKYCDKNPENSKRCSNCTFLIEQQIEYTVSEFNGFDEVDEKRTAKGFRCTKLDKILYPLKVEKLGLPAKFPETFADQEPMPRECELFEHIW